MYRNARREICPQCNREVPEGEIRERQDHYAIAMTTYRPKGERKPTMRCCDQCESNNIDCI